MAGKENAENKNPQSNPEEIKIAAQEEFQLLLDSTSREYFEDGIEELFVEDLESYLNTYGDVEVKTISKLREENKIDHEHLIATIRTFGKIGSKETVDTRFKFLTDSFDDPSPAIRHVSAMTLSYFGHVTNKPETITVLRSAMEKETHAAVKKSFETAISNLQEKPLNQ